MIRKIIASLILVFPCFQVVYGDSIPARLSPVEANDQISGCYLAGHWLLGGSIDGGYWNITVSEALEGSRVTEINTSGVSVMNGFAMDDESANTVIWSTNMNDWPDSRGHRTQSLPWEVVFDPASDSIYWKAQLFQYLSIARKVAANPCTHRRPK